MVQVDRPSDEMAVIDIGAAVEVKVVDRDVLVSSSPATAPAARESVGAASDAQNGV